MKRAKKAKTKKTKPPPAVRIFVTKNVGFGKHKKCKEEKTHPPSRRKAEYVPGRFLFFERIQRKARHQNVSVGHGEKRRSHRKAEYKKTRDTMARSRAFRLSEGIKKYKYRLFCK